MGTSRTDKLNTYYGNGLKMLGLFSCSPVMLGVCGSLDIEKIDFPQEGGCDCTFHQGRCIACSPCIALGTLATTSLSGVALIAAGLSTTITYPVAALLDCFLPTEEEAKLMAEMEDAPKISPDDSSDIERSWSINYKYA